MMVLDWNRFQKNVQAYRDRVFRLSPQTHIRDIQEARRFVEECGFVLFWPFKGHVYPSLWSAAAGDRPVPDEHDDPGHVTWGWKDEALGKRYWYYARLLRRRNTMVSLECAPYFYALSPNYGDPENDYLEQYRQGILTAEAKVIYETLLRDGALDTISLRREARLSSKSSDARFSKAVDDLMMEMKILPVGISQAGAWRYAFIYDLVPRHFPNLPEIAREISESNARKYLLMRYYHNLGAADPVEACRFFRWRIVGIQEIVNELVSSEHLVSIEDSDQGKRLLALPELL